ncbi:hypothetical protein [Endozoicomonas sp. 8E]|uniref:hypothetical protein n=1 Tax=Endozoicomonas sp. 8E TaxID=3035692 RepID=UPI002939405D|nr:hypothetical protein [Endozoicomonas sp. 8E]WOG27105.1 hypothetical protein P6910_21520 [Endozoicomonas sp. 8E]
MTTINPHLSFNPYSLLPVEVTVTVVCILKSYWSPYSSLFSPTEQHKTTPILIQMDRPFAIITAMFGSGHIPTKNQLSESSGQQPPQGTTRHTGMLTSPLNSDSGGGSGGSQKHLHTLDLNCYADPCHGVCQFRPSSDNRESAEWRLNFEGSYTVNTEATPGQGSCSHLADGYCFSCIVHFDPTNPAYSQQDFPFEALNSFSVIQL